MFLYNPNTADDKEVRLNEDGLFEEDANVIISTSSIHNRYSIYILSNIYRYSFRDNGNDLSCSEAIWNAGLLFLYIFNNYPQNLKLSENLHF